MITQGFSGELTLNAEGRAPVCCCNCGAVSDRGVGMMVQKRQWTKIRGGESATRVPVGRASQVLRSKVKTQ